MCSFIALQWTPSHIFCFLILLLRVTFLIVPELLRGCNSWFNILFTDCTWAMTWSALSSCWRTRGGYREENMFKVASVTRCGFCVLICKVLNQQHCWVLFYFMIFNQQFHLCCQHCSKNCIFKCEMSWHMEEMKQGSLHWKQVKYPDCIVRF